MRDGRTSDGPEEQIGPDLTLGWQRTGTDHRRKAPINTVQGRYAGSCGTIPGAGHSGGARI